MPSKNEKNIPQHIGLIMDGNRRWAKSNNLPTFEGHRKGYDNIKKIATHAFKKGVGIITVYAFSTENWHRSKEEVAYLLKLFSFFVSREVSTLMKQGIKINFFGRLQDFSQELQDGIRDAEKRTRANKKGVLNICLSYGGRDEIVRAFKKIIKQGAKVSDISEDLINKNLDSATLADPDLIIRTSGEQRLSGFLTWQSVYSELYFIKKYWPDFNISDLNKAIDKYGERQRRHGR